LEVVVRKSAMRTKLTSGAPTNMFKKTPSRGILMNEEHASLAAELDIWPTKKSLMDLLTSDGFDVAEGKYSIRLKGFEHFIFRELDGDLGAGSITADHVSTKELVDFSRRVSQTLAKGNIKHRFEVYSGGGELAAYLHHDWPKDW
jgi:hypothetical protein